MRTDFVTLESAERLQEENAEKLSEIKSFIDEKLRQIWGTIKRDQGKVVAKSPSKSNLVGNETNNTDGKKEKTDIKGNPTETKIQTTPRRDNYAIESTKPTTTTLGKPSRSKSRGKKQKGYVYVKEAPLEQTNYVMKKEYDGIKK